MRSWDTEKGLKTDSFSIIRHIDFKIDHIVHIGLTYGISETLSRFMGADKHKAYRETIQENGGITVMFLTLGSISMIKKTQDD